MRDEDYWYGPGWKRLRNAAWILLRRCQDRHPGTMDRGWLEKHFLPELARRHTLFWQLVTRLFFDLDTLADKLAACEKPDHQCRALKDFLWEQKLIVQDGASPDRVKTWRRILKRIRAHFPENTDWQNELNQQRLLDVLPRNKHLPSTLKTLQVYLGEFWTQAEEPYRSVESMDGEELRQLALHTPSFFEAVAVKFEYCMDELQRQAPLLFAAVRAARDGQSAPPDSSPATQSRRKQAGIDALADCMEPVTTFQEIPQ